MTSLTLRSVKGSPLTHDEVDANFSDLNTDKLEYSSLSVSTAAASGGGSLSYLSGVFTYTPPNLSGYLTSYTETDTLDSVTTRGATTTNAITVGQATVTGDLIVDTSTLFVDASANSVGIGNAAPSEKLHVTGNILASGDVTAASVNIGLWEITLDGSDLRFIYDGVDRLRLTTAGALIAGNDVTAFGSP